jgi:hypothetical protein
VYINNNQPGTAGSATFDNGGTARILTQTTSLSIRGTANSSVKGNLELRCCNATSATFSVRTWPSAFRETSRGTSADGVITFAYSWGSESGVLADVTDVWVGEYIIADPTPKPPYQSDYLGYPTAWRNYIWRGYSPPMPDSHLHQPFKTPYCATTHHTTQYYQLRDDVLDVEAELEPSVAHESIRTTEQQGSSWIYKVTKDGKSNSLIMP